MLAIIGLGLIHVSTEKIMPKEPALNEIDSSWAGEKVRVEGEIKSRTFSDGNLFMEIGAENMTVVQFGTENRFERGQNVTVEGEVRIYQGELEIIAESIE